MVMDEENESYHYYRGSILFYSGRHSEVNRQLLNRLTESWVVPVFALNFDPRGHQHITGESRVAVLLRT
jgi:hypothetical protein